MTGTFHIVRMPYYPIHLAFAGIPLQLLSASSKEVVFLKKKYTDFLLPATARKKPFATIHISPGDKEVAHRNNKYILPASPQHNFLRFNDFLRIIFVDIINKHQGCIIHASAFAHKKRGYIFIGPETAGKSTIRKLSARQYLCLGDDVAILRKMSKTYYLFGSPFYQKTKRSYPNVRVKLTGIFWLEKASHTLIRTLSYGKRLTALSSQAFVSSIPQTKAVSRAFWSRIVHLARQPYFFSLAFSLTEFFWPAVIYASTHKWLLTPSRLPYKQANQRIIDSLPLNIRWQPAICTHHFLEQCDVIHERSWQFEFGGERNIPIIAQMIQLKHIDSSHTELIRQKKILFNLKKVPWLSLLVKDGKYTLIDGNHTAVAAYLASQVKKPILLRLCLGQLSHNQASPWLK